MKKFLLSTVALFVAMIFTSANAEKFQFRGSVNNWLNKVDQETVDKYTFKPGDTPDTWVLTDLGVFYWVSEGNNNNRFKIVECENGDRWFSPNTTTMDVGENRKLVNGGDSGFNLPESRYINKITITKKEDGNYYMSYECSRAKYIYGDKIAGKKNWDFDKPTGSVLVERFDEEFDKNVFYGHIVMGASEDGKCYWRIYDKPVDDPNDYQYSWGFNGNDNAPQEQATFEAKKGSKSCFVTEPEQGVSYTVYQIKFFENENQGGSGTVCIRKLDSFNEIPSGVEGVEKATAKVYGGQGEIRVEGVAGQFAVYSYSGALVTTGSEVVSVPAGMYIVLVDGVATKVVVR